MSAHAFFSLADGGAALTAAVFVLPEVGQTEYELPVLWRKDASAPPWNATETPSCSPNAKSVRPDRVGSCGSVQSGVVSVAPELRHTGKAHPLPPRSPSPRGPGPWSGRKDLGPRSRPVRASRYLQHNVVRRSAREPVATACGASRQSNSLGPTMRYSAPSRRRVELPDFRVTKLVGLGLMGKDPSPGP